MIKSRLLEARNLRGGTRGETPFRMLGGVCLWKRLETPEISRHNWRPLGWKQQGDGTWNCLLGLLGSRKTIYKPSKFGCPALCFQFVNGLFALAAGFSFLLSSFRRFRHTLPNNALLDGFALGLFLPSEMHNKQLGFSAPQNGKLETNTSETEIYNLQFFSRIWNFQPSLSCPSGLISKRPIL